jgi:hypothetical protein
MLQRALAEDVRSTGVVERYWTRHGSVTPDVGLNRGFGSERNWTTLQIRVRWEYHFIIPKSKYKGTVEFQVSLQLQRPKDF